MNDVPCLRCPRCNGRRTAEDFASPTGTPFRTCRRCRETALAANRRRRLKIGAAGVRAENLRAKYGISVDEYDRLRLLQDHRCAICRRHEDELPSAAVGRPRLDGLPTAEPLKLAVDHCHRTGLVRGLLCTGCNAAIGHFRDDPVALRNAISYLTDQVLHESRERP